MAQVLRRQILGGQTLFTAEALDSDWPEGFPGCRGGCTLTSDAARWSSGRLTFYEHELIFMFVTARLLSIGLAFWGAGAFLMRWFGAEVISTEHIAITLATYAASFIAMAAGVPAIFTSMRITRTLWFRSAALLMLPSLILDALTQFAFSRAYPNMSESAAGLFGGLILICCAGALVGVWVRE
jgi:hypothetical protein